MTSGTDTLEETAFFLHLTVRDPRPVVVVGSMRNPSTLGYEGAANLLEGVRVAADPAARNKGALVVLNDEINSARNVTKTDAVRLQTFRSRDYGQLGVVDRDRVVFFSQITQRANERSEFDITRITELPRVDVIMVYQGATGDLIKAAVDSGAKGIIMATAGAGALSGTQGEGLQYAAQKGVFVVTTTRAGSGRIAPRSDTANPNVTIDRGRAAPPAVHDRGRRSHSREGARAADARADEDDRPQRDSAHLQRILTGSQTVRLVTACYGLPASSTRARRAIQERHDGHVAVLAGLADRRPPFAVARSVRRARSRCVSWMSAPLLDEQLDDRAGARLRRRSSADSRRPRPRGSRRRRDRSASAPDRAGRGRGHDQRAAIAFDRQFGSAP